MGNKIVIAYGDVWVAIANMAVELVVAPVEGDNWNQLMVRVHAKRIRGCSLAVGIALTVRCQRYGKTNPYIVD